VGNSSSQCLWAGMHPRANEFQQSSLPDYQRMYRPAQWRPPRGDGKAPRHWFPSSSARQDCDLDTLLAMHIRAKALDHLLVVITTTHSVVKGQRPGPCSLGGDKQFNVPFSYFKFLFSPGKYKLARTRDQRGSMHFFSELLFNRPQSWSYFALSCQIFQVMM